MLIIVLGMCCQAALRDELRAALLELQPGLPVPIREAGALLLRASLARVLAAMRMLQLLSLHREARGEAGRSIFVVAAEAEAGVGYAPSCLVAGKGSPLPKRLVVILHADACDLPATGRAVAIQFLSVAFAYPEAIDLTVVVDLELVLLLCLIYAAGVDHHVVVVLDSGFGLQGGTVTDPPLLHLV